MCEKYLVLLVRIVSHDEPRTKRNQTLHSYLEDRCIYFLHPRSEKQSQYTRSFDRRCSFVYSQEELSAGNLRCRCCRFLCMFRYFLLQFGTFERDILEPLLLLVERVCNVGWRLVAVFTFDCGSNDPTYLDKIRLRINDRA